MASTLTAAGIDELRGRLEAERARLRERGSTTDASAEPTGDDLPRRDGLDEVGQALERIERGGYGVCKACGRAIDAEHLSVRPAARFCVQDQEEFERATTLGGASR